VQVGLGQLGAQEMPRVNGVDHLTDFANELSIDKMLLEIVGSCTNPAQRGPLGLGQDKQDGASAACGALAWFAQFTTNTTAVRAGTLKLPVAAV
jgi:hypothetical protein